MEVLVRVPEMEDWRSSVPVDSLSFPGSAGEGG